MTTRKPTYTVCVETKTERTVSRFFSTLRAARTWKTRLAQSPLYIAVELWSDEGGAGNHLIECARRATR